MKISLQRRFSNNHMNSNIRFAERSRSAFPNSMVYHVPAFDAEMYDFWSDDYIQGLIPEDNYNKLFIPSPELSQHLKQHYPKQTSKRIKPCNIVNLHITSVLVQENCALNAIDFYIYNVYTDL